MLSHHHVIILFALRVKEIGNVLHMCKENSIYVKNMLSTEDMNSEFPEKYYISIWELVDEDSLHP